MGKPSDKAPPDIESLPLEGLSWKNPQETEASIRRAYAYAEERAEQAVQWYLKNKGWKAFWSRSLRISAILLTTLGGLAPIVGSTGWLKSQSFDYEPVVKMLGYVFLALAAACVGLDRFFGFSSGWMRYITTALALEKSLSEFRMAWAMTLAKLGGATPTEEQVQSMLQKVKEFVAYVDGTVEEETRDWVTEFRTSLSDVDRTAKELGKAARPGAIDVTVTNGMDAEGGFDVALDGMNVRAGVRGTKYHVGYVPPGPHKIEVSARVGGQAFGASELVNVGPGEIAKATLALPFRKAQP
ncbi:MAG: SLATT domain-containing protein [Acidobacteria bacterium]|nr:SLATT domain-containing protein [Acidobacteriota bacterium]